MEHRKPPIIIAHRGFSDEAPENTMAAFHKAIDSRCDMIELDVRLSSDNVPIVFHDRTLQRTSDSYGAVNEKLAEQLTLIDNGSWFSPKFHRERIPSLSEVLPLTKKDVTFNIEIKPDVVSTNGTSAMEIVVDEVRKAKARSKVIFTSFNHKMIKEIKEIDDDLVTGVIYNPITHFRKSPSTLIKTVKANIFVCSKFQINRDVVTDTQDAGYALYVYGVKTGRDVQRMLDLKVDGIICNNPKFVRETVELLRT
ncbi:MAG: glycerophosphodiester phosphodiesterase family protein [Bacteroidota bacterium]|nr:glycerophosphodiester phosphodiesterase family protein [Bacteroidota bacterium]